MDFVPYSDANFSEGESKVDSAEKCQVCSQPSHGRHFGVETCRACAAFFRRYNVPKQLKRQTRDLKCRQARSQCEPHDNGKWYCKKCRMDKCVALGMTPENIQFNRDVFSSCSRFKLAKKLKSSNEKIPTAIEQVIGKPHVILWFYKERDPNQSILFIDFSHLIENVCLILRNPPDVDETMNSLEKLKFGLQEVRRTQKTDEIVEMKRMGKTETARSWESSITFAAKWLMYSDEFRALRFDDKVSVVKCMWHVFTRLERAAMTAEMRRRGQCGKRQFVFSRDAYIDYDSCEVDVKWFTDLTAEEVEFFLGPLTRWFYDDLVGDIMEMQPSDTEITYLISILCFQLTGKKFGGAIQDYTDQLQDVLADDLHNYYVNQGNQRRYSHRLVNLLRINKKYKKQMRKGHDILTVASVLDAFKVDFSHPELFLNST